MKKMAALCLYALLCAGAVPAKDNLAVLTFSGGTGTDGETIADLFSINKELNEVFSPIPRTSIARAIDKERAFQVSGMTDPDTIADIGKELGARYVVAGNIAELGKRKLLIISIMNIDDLRQISGDIQTYKKIEEIKDKLPEMARNIIAAAKLEPSGAEKLAVMPVEMDDTIDRRAADTLAQILSINIIRSGKYLVYPRTGTLDQVKAEYNYQLSGEIEDESVRPPGKGDNPRLVLSVTARQLGRLKMFNASIINLETGVQIIGRSVNYKTLDDGIEAMQTLARELTGGPGDTDLGGGKKPADGLAWNTLGRGALNLALGLGSFLQKDWAGGGVILAGYGAAAGLIAWELSLSYEDPLAGVPGTAGLAVAGAAVVYGFVRPFVYRRSPALAGMVDGIHLAVVPENRGGAAVRLSYTVRF